MLHLSADSPCDISATVSEGLWEQGGAAGGIFNFFSSPDVRSHPQLSGTYGSPHSAVQLWYSWLEVCSGEFILQWFKNLWFLSLQSISLLESRLCSAEQDCWGFFGSVCCKPQQWLFGVWIACIPLGWTKAVAKVPSGCSRSQQCCTQ